MATFYLLPPRACLDDSMSTLLGKLLPGLPVPADAWEALVQHFTTIANWPGDVFLVPRDDLPEGDPVTVLTECYGAEPGDRVVEVGLARPARVWSIPAAIPGTATAR